jgi:hypothetical protein
LRFAVGYCRPAASVAALCLLTFPLTAGDDPASISALTRSIPAGLTTALTGSGFAASVAAMNLQQREQAILRQILAGNIPLFLRHLAPVELHQERPGGATLTATVFVMPEYLAIGSDTDFLRVPMNLYTASAIASRLGFVLPTRKIVDAIYRQAAFRFSPEPMAPGPRMTSTGYYQVHNAKIEEQSRALGITLGSLVSGHKKDVVVSRLLDRNPGRIAIYGWHKPTGAAIQPLSTVHGACYADYSHGIRLVSETVLIDGEARSIYDVLADPQLAGILSDEGPIPHLRDFMTRTAAEAAPCEPALLSKF